MIPIKLILAVNRAYLALILSIMGHITFYICRGIRQADKQLPRFYSSADYEQKYLTSLGEQSRS